LRQTIFRWSGDPAAYVEDRCVFDYQGRYLGWIATDNSVWAANGRHVGDLLDAKLLFRNTVALARMPRLPRVAPHLNPSAPSSLPRKRAPRPAMYGWIGALDSFRPVPIS
jgi:hypothetical protein